MGLPPRDFESRASTSFTTPAFRPLCRLVQLVCQGRLRPERRLRIADCGLRIGRTGAGNREEQLRNAEWGMRRTGAGGRGSIGADGPHDHGPQDHGPQDHGPQDHWATGPGTADHRTGVTGWYGASGTTGPQDQGTVVPFRIRHSASRIQAAELPRRASTFASHSGIGRCWGHLGSHSPHCVHLSARFSAARISR